MTTKRGIQTAVNVQSGGVNQGLAKLWYQSETEVLVIAPPIADTPRQSATHRANPEKSRHLVGDNIADAIAIRSTQYGPEPVSRGGQIAPTSNVDQEPALQLRAVSGRLMRACLIGFPAVPAGSRCRICAIAAIALDGGPG